MLKVKKGPALCFFLFIFTLKIFGNGDIALFDDYDFEEAKVLGYLMEGDEYEITSYMIPERLYDGRWGVPLYIKSAKIEGWVFSDDLELSSKERLPVRRLGLWGYSYYLTAIKNGSGAVIEGAELGGDEMSPREFWWFFSPLTLTINERVISYTAGMGGELFYIDRVKRVGLGRYELWGRYGDPELHGLKPEDISKIELYFKMGRLSKVNGWGYEFSDLEKIDSSVIEALLSIQDDMLN